jgi:hypothetical protein
VAAPASGKSAAGPARTPADRKVPAVRDPSGNASRGRGVGTLAVALIALAMLAGLAYLFYINVLADRFRGGTDGPGVFVQAPTTPPDDGKGRESSPPVVPGPSKTETPPSPGKQPSGGDKEIDVADLKKPDKPESPPVLPPVARPDPPVAGAPGSPEKAPTQQGPPPPTIEVTVPAQSTVPGVDAARVEAAIARGVAYLKKGQLADGSWGGDRLMAYTALCGLTLLECKVPASHQSVINAAEVVRGALPNSNATYDLSVGILFLDRLGDTKDRPLIQAAAIRLLSGQDLWGGWNYTCDPLPPAATQEMLTFLKAKRPKALPPPPTKLLSRWVDPQGPSPIIGELQWNRWGGQVKLYPGDNSNTQFALLALWVARRHDVPAELPLVCSYHRYQIMQNADGGWAHHVMVPKSTNSMTCVGLLGLAIGRGAVPGAAAGKDKLEDPAIHRALQALGRYIGTPAKDAGARPPMQNLYFLWSVERVAMLYSLKTIGGKDWYGWGAQILLANQRADGSWAGMEYTGRNELVDTCFALLFLSRSNLVSDLTENLRLHMVIRDPGAK